ncbi:L-lactate dehydrogenase [Thalassoporum mexicanum PCC 7367]|uniref:L-lactate dehydrogenase n=1 Tax=Thalassoporum mexicanum TaxID=3457544 RepID=UPI00029F8198|nr:L-lactate dehydrogenase [Pseudanabaena sp. PCC 7367]AFY70884.1 L-lactate dehydrogenase [Pseudanabaena sp. PCC 7367]
MLDQIFTPIGDSLPLVSQDLRKAAIIGAGQVGMACAYSMLIQNTLDELIITDINQEKLEGEVMDLVHGLSFVEPSVIKAGTIEDYQDLDLVIITAGAKQHPGESRLNLVQRNVEIFKSIVPEVVKRSPNAILLIVSNPVDIMTYVSLKLSGLPASRVIGSGTVLDTARFKYLLGQKLKLDSRNVHGYILGEHGDSEVALWSELHIGGSRLDQLIPNWREPEVYDQLDQVYNQVKNAAYEIIQRKGATSYAIGLGVTQIAQAILRDQNHILTVSSLIKDFYGINDVCFSIPAVVNRQGVERQIAIYPSDEELAQLRKSAQLLKEITSGIGF